VRVSSLALPLLCLAVLGPRVAWSHDIACETAEEPAERVICDHAILNFQYNRIYEQQQTMLRDGRLSKQDLISWKHLRNACSDVHCIDGVFAAWAKAVQVTSNPAVRQDSSPSSEVTNTTPDGDLQPRMTAAPVYDVQQQKKTTLQNPVEVRQQPAKVQRPAPSKQPVQSKTEDSSSHGWLIAAIIAVCVVLSKLFGQSKKGRKDSSKNPRVVAKAKTDERRKDGEHKRQRAHETQADNAARSSKTTYGQRQWLRDSHNNSLGYTCLYSDGKQYIYTKDGTPLGFYNPNFDATFKKDGTRIAKGNMLLLLLK
jgi:uncharacterized protein